MSRRIERVNSLVRSVISEAIQRRLSDPRIEPLTSITRVEVSTDLSNARVHVSVMATDARKKLCVQALQHAAGRLRGMLAEQLTMRQVPRLLFCLDDSVQRAFETVETIDSVMAEYEQESPEDVNTEPEPVQEDAERQSDDLLQQNPPVAHIPIPPEDNVTETGTARLDRQEDF